METRHVQPQITLASGADVTADLAPHLLSMSVSDALHGQADAVTLRLEDRDGLWSGRWMPQKGARITVGLRLAAWDSPEAEPAGAPTSTRRRSVTFGTFEIDDVRLEGYPSTVTVKGLSAVVTRALRTTRRTHAWESATVGTIALDVARRHGLAVKYSACARPRLARAEQTQEPDLDFLAALCERFNLHLKVTPSHLLVTDDDAVAASVLASPITRSAMALRAGSGTDGAGSRYELSDQAWNLAAACRCVYDDPASGAVIDVTVTDSAVASGETLLVNEQLDDAAQAELRAAAALARHNRDAVSGRWSGRGRPELRAGYAVRLEGFRAYDGTYFIDASTHEYSRSGYTTSVSIRRQR